MAPRWFSWLTDFIMISVAFVAAYICVPISQRLILPGSALHSLIVHSLSAPGNLTGQLQPIADLLWMLIIQSAITVMALEILNGYHSPQSRTRIILQTAFAVFSGTSVIVITLFALKDASQSRLFIFSFGVLSSIGLIAYRLVYRTTYRLRQEGGHYARNIVVIGLPSGINWAVCYFAENVPAAQHRLIGYLNVDPNRPFTETCEPAIKPMGALADLGNLLINAPIHGVLVIYPITGGEWLQNVVQVCDYMGVELLIVPEVLLADQEAFRTLYRSKMLNLPAVVITPPNWNSETLFIKRVLDVIISVVLLIVLAPLFGIIALAIKITSPNLPVFYRWCVVGQNGVEFVGYKFTTMVLDADARKPQLVEYNEMQGPVFKMKDDPRVTPLGRFLRKYSLNELPQLWSVLKGDMSLVGPRPAFRHELERYEFWHKRKLSVKPGITCLWQVNGRNKITHFDDWVRMDLEYIDRWSLWLDFKILLRTVWVVIAGSGS